MKVNLVHLLPFDTPRERQLRQRERTYMKLIGMRDHRTVVAARYGDDPATSTGGRTSIGC